jgi:short-subunit dehydrogenase
MADAAFRSAPSRRRALVTGASRGLGEALALEAPEDVDLVLSARDAAALDGVADRARAQGRDVETIVADLADAESRAALIARVEDRIDLLVNNAGVGAWGRFLSRAPEEHATAAEVDVVAPTELSRRLLPGMITRAGMLGRRAGLINVASSLAFAPAPTFAVYAASKAYLLSLTEALAAELASEPVDVLALCPGPVRTEFGRRAGFGREIPGAMTPAAVARAGWGALGRQRSAVVGLLDTPVFTPAALARSAAAEVAARGARLVELMTRRS